MAHVVLRVARHAGVVALFVVAALLGLVSGVLFAYMGDLPRISALDDYTPNTITRVLAADGQVVAEFATERRVVVSYDDISPLLRQAIVAAEDAGFERHVGLSISRILITAVQDVIKRRMAGASTLTMQLARNLFLTYEKTWERKIKEALLAVQIERRYTKREIFTFYANQIYFGHGAYGVEAASRMYFDRPSKELTLEEAALIAGIIQLPQRQSPFVDVGRATGRRNYVLRQMADEGYITREQAEKAAGAPVVVRGEPRQGESIAPFYVEEVRKYLERKYGAKQLYEKGLTVHTALDPVLQVAANEAVDAGLRALDRRRGFRKPQRNLVDEARNPDGYHDVRWDRPIAVGQVLPALVTAVSKPGTAVRRGAAPGAAAPLAAGNARVRLGQQTADLGREAVAWTRRRHASDLLRVGDLIEVRIRAIDAATGAISATLEQTPLVDGALLAMDNRTGQILAMVGGLSFGRSKFNRATQAQRQLGSVFKPFVYTVAIDRGLTPASIVLDTPASFEVGEGQPPYAPRDYDGQYEGAITLRRALEQSRNIPAVRTIDQVGPQQVVDYARRFGFEGPLQPFLSLALGAGEATLVETVAAYGVFPNQGVRMRPYQILKIVDRNGNVLEENRPQSREAIRADTAYVMTSLLRGVVQRGTGASAASLQWPLGGKTGTTNDYTDAWFVGFDPHITAGAWVGHDDKKPLGPSETGTVAALPIWTSFMKAYIEARGDRKTPPAFEAPGNIILVNVDRATGRPSEGAATGAINEVF
ncbi:MAG TPA: PBP1A family penicillin-binding protein, partial [Vicinamibacterales bacterium]|nr:PBP1A family penicillin-binding protein [Vicinamibacterales bacterium]